MITENNNTNKNITSRSSQTDLPNLIDDSCNCNSCQAVLFMSIFGKYIPITQKQLDEILYPNTFLRYLVTGPIKTVSYIYPSSFKLE